MVKTLLIIILCTIFNTIVDAQNKMNDSEKSFEFTITPTFKYGDLYLEQYINNKIEYKEADVEKCGEGRVIIQLLLDKDGKITKVGVEKSHCPALDSAAFEMASQMPYFEMNGLDSANYYVFVDFKFKDNWVICDIKPAPSFPGGEEAFYSYLNKNIKKPASFKKDKIKGKVIVNFTLEKGGKVSEVELVEGLRDDIDQVVLEVIKKMPKWENVDIKTTFKLPISIK